MAEVDPDRMAAAFFAPASARADLMALYAFGLELGRIRDVVREPMAAQMRFAWWREQVNRIGAGQAPETPLGRSLAGAVAARQLPVPLIHDLLDARALETGECPFPDEVAFENYAAGAFGAPMKLAARICGAGAAADAIAGPAGLAHAIASVIRALPRDAGARRCYIPLSVLARRGASAEDIFARDAPRARAAILDMTERAQKAILAARRMIVPGKAVAAILPAVLARQHLPIFRKPAFDPFTPGPPLSRLTAALSLAQAAFTQRL